MPHSLKLKYSDRPLFGRRGAPTMQKAKIHINTHTRDADDIVCITPECVSVGELEGEIDRLQVELEEIRTLARRKFAMSDQRNRQRSTTRGGASN